MPCKLGSLARYLRQLESSWISNFVIHGSGVRDLDSERVPHLHLCDDDWQPDAAYDSAGHRTAAGKLGVLPS
eukprot:6081135-Pleurochrysis_carterae.AAC.1